MDHVAVLTRELVAAKAEMRDALREKDVQIIQLWMAIERWRHKYEPIDQPIRDPRNPQIFMALEFCLNFQWVGEHCVEIEVFADTAPQTSRCFIDMCALRPEIRSGDARVENLRFHCTRDQMLLC